MLDWLLARQRWIETSLAKRHLQDATLLLYDVSSSYLEGRLCPLAAFGYNRDGKKGKQQIVFGLLCSAAGCPLAVEVFPGNTADPTTLGRQVDKIRKRFGIARIALVGDRGMLTTARIRADLQPAGLDWISALTTKHLRKLVAAPGQAGQGQQGQAPLAADSLVPDAVAEITSPDFPGERLLLCLNPRLRRERRRKREDLLQATERILEGIATAVRDGRLAGEAAIGRRIGEQANRYRVRKHFALHVTQDSFSWERQQDSIAAEARLDGLYAIRTSLPDLAAEAAVEAYKSLSGVERAFRTSKDHLRVRPIHVYSENHVRGHVFLCMCAYYVEWHMRRRLAPLLFQDDDPLAARARRDTPVEPAEVSGSRQGQGRHQDHTGGVSRAQLPDPAGGSLHHRSEPPHPAHPGEDRHHHRHRAHHPPAPGLRPARSRSASDCSHNRDRLRAALGQAKPYERNKLCNEHGLNLP